MNVPKILSRAEQAARAGKSKGFTLIELMVAMVVSGIVLLGIFAFSSIQQGNAVIHRRHVRIQQALEGSMYSIGRDVRSAGLGFARMCTEVRIWDPNQNRLINPGAEDTNLSTVVVDADTDEPYWVLRDGIQAHWRSPGAVSIEGDDGTSASPTSAADSFDVMLGERNYTSALGVFSLSAAPPSSAANAVLDVTGSSLLDSSDNDHVNWVRQMFPPGSFVLIARPTNTADPFRPGNRGQCALVQVTDDVIGGGGLDWQLPIGEQSGFNKDLGELFGDEPDLCPDGTCDDWDTIDRDAGALVVPLGRVRWSRYEIDYTVPGKPYLVRSDFIGFVPGTDPTTTGDQDYPDCDGAQCPLPQLHLPNLQGRPIPKVAVGPMIEDMQVAVGCDGYTAVSAVDDVEPDLPVPDTDPQDFGEKGDENDGLPNKFVDEWDNDKTQDEWVGNAAGEQWAPDCVYYGTGQEFNGDNPGQAWASTGPAAEQLVAPGFRMSPSTIRVTLLGKSETMAGGNAEDPSDEFFNQLFPIEDRQKMDTIAGGRAYLTLTERFSPRNLRWRDPLLR